MRLFTNTLGSAVNTFPICNSNASHFFIINSNIFRRPSKVRIKMFNKSDQRNGLVQVKKYWLLGKLYETSLYIPMMVSGKAVWLVGFVEAALGGGSEGAEPVLHLAARLGAQHQGSERGDHLEEKNIHFYSRRVFTKLLLTGQCFTSYFIRVNFEVGRSTTLECRFC